MKRQTFLTLTTIALLGWSIQGFAYILCPAFVNCAINNTNCQFNINEGGWRIIWESFKGPQPVTYNFEFAQINSSQSPGLCYYGQKNQGIIILQSSQILYPMGSNWGHTVPPYQCRPNNPKPEDCLFSKTQIHLQNKSK